MLDVNIELTFHWNQTRFLLLKTNKLNLPFFLMLQVLKHVCDITKSRKLAHLVWVCFQRIWCPGIPGLKMKSVAILIHFYLYRLRYTCCSMLTRKGILSVCNNWQEHLDYELVQSTNPEFNKAVVRVNIFRDHRQTIQVSIKRGMFLIPISATCIDKPPIIV